MNGKVNAATLGLANLFTKAQVKQATQGVVKSISGQFPDSDGNVDLVQTITVNITDGTAINPSIINYYGKETMNDLVTMLRNTPAYNVVFIRDIINTSGKSEGKLKNTGFKLYKTEGNIYNAVIYFSDDTCPFILDSASNKILLDPDWVAPEPTATQSYVTQAIAPIQEDVGNLESGKVSLPVTNSTPNYGTAGQFAVSDGNGGITWKTLVEAEGVDY